MEALIDLIKTESAEDWCSIKSRKQDTLIPQGQSVLVLCRATIDPVGKIPVLFELDPDSSCPSGLEIPETQLTVAGASTRRVNIRVDNLSKHDVLKGGTVLGRLQQVKSVTPLEVKLKETPVPTADGPSTVDTSGESGSSSNCCTEKRKEVEGFEIKQPPCSYIPSIDTDKLSEEQKTTVMKMLEEAESFSQTDHDVGQAEELQVDINLTDSVPVQKRYNSIPRPLHAEVKQYVEDLLNRAWIQKSRSAYRILGTRRLFETGV